MIAQSLREHGNPRTYSPSLIDRSRRTFPGASAIISRNYVHRKRFPGTVYNRFAARSTSRRRFIYLFVLFFASWALSLDQHVRLVLLLEKSADELARASYNRRKARERERLLRAAAANWWNIHSGRTGVYAGKVRHGIIHVGTPPSQRASPVMSSS